MSNTTNQKIPCGGFEIGSGLSLGGGVLDVNSPVKYCCLEEDDSGELRYSADRGDIHNWQDLVDWFDDVNAPSMLLIFGSYFFTWQSTAGKPGGYTSMVFSSVTGTFIENMGTLNIIMITINPDLIQIDSQHFSLTTNS